MVEGSREAPTLARESAKSLSGRKEKKLQHRCCRRGSLEGHSLQVSQKQDLDREFMFLLPQATVLAGSDADIDGVETASGFVIQNSHTSFCVCCPIYCTLLGRCLRFFQRRCTRNRSKTPYLHEQI